MMQKCSELGNNPEAWQQLFRFGKNRLKVKKGPSGHYLEQECREELKKTLPAKAFDSLMSSVATWMARLDEKDNKVRLQQEATVKVPKKLQSEPPLEQQTSEDGDNNKLSAVVDLCSDGDEKDSLGENEDSFDTEAVLSQSSIIIIDDDLGEVNLKDFADHVEGKLDVQTLKKNNQNKQNTPNNFIVKFLGPRKPDDSARPLKTYANKRKSTVQTIGEALSEAMATSNDPKILREVNREATREAGQKLRKSDCQGPKVDKDITPDGDRTLVAAGNSQQKVQIVTEPTAYYNLIAKPGVEDKLKQSELDSKSDVEKKTEPEIRTNTKENEPKTGLNLEQAEGEQTKEVALPEDSLRNQRLEQDNHAPQIRIRTDLGPHQRDVIRVRTDLLLEQPPEESLNSLGNQTSSAKTVVPERTSNKRILSEAHNSQHPPKRPALDPYYPQYAAGPVTAPSSCQLSISHTPVSSSGYPASTPRYQGNPAPVKPPPVNPTPARPSPVNPARAPPVVTVRYKIIAPRASAPVTSTSTSTSTSTANNNSYQRDVSNSCQTNLPSTSSHNHNSVNSASASSSGYPSGSHMCPVSSTSSHQPINPANRPPVTNGRRLLANPMPPPPAASSNYSSRIPGTADRSAPSPIIPMMNKYPPSQYQPPMSMPIAPVGTSTCPPGAPAAPLPSSIYIQVPPVAPAPAPAANGGPPMVDRRTDLATILDMLSQVELFAFRQENQEAFHLVTQLRNSLQRGAPFAYRR